ncbi:GHKL domain-containing protein, partial [Enterocloster asparagiformis]
PGKPSVDLAITNFRGYLRCTLENTVNRDLLESNPGFGTDKDDKINHGFGIKSIRRIVELYDGASKSELICRENGWVLRQELLLGFPRTERFKSPQESEKAAGDHGISGV